MWCNHCHVKAHPRERGHPLFLPPEQAAVSPRVIWAANRFWMETENLKSGRYGGESHHHWYALLFLMKSLRGPAQALGQLRARRAQRVGRRGCARSTSRLPRLPRRFDGFTILHLSDLHLDGMPGLERTILDLVRRAASSTCACSPATTAPSCTARSVRRWTGLGRWSSRRPQPPRLPGRPRQPRRLPHGRADGSDGHPDAHQRGRRDRARRRAGSRSSAPTTSTTTSPTRRCTRSRRPARPSPSRSSTRRSSTTSPPSMGSRPLPLRSHPWRPGRPPRRRRDHHAPLPRAALLQGDLEPPRNAGRHERRRRHLGHPGALQHARRDPRRHPQAASLSRMGTLPKALRPRATLRSCSNSIWAGRSAHPRPSSRARCRM